MSKILKSIQNRARELARSGQFIGWRAIAFELRFEPGYSEASDWVLSLATQEELGRPKAAPKPPFDYCKIATAAELFFREPGFSLRPGSGGIFWLETGDVAPAGRGGVRPRRNGLSGTSNGGRKNGSARQGSGRHQIVRSGCGVRRGAGAAGPSRRQEADAFGDDGVHDGLYVPRHLQHE